MLLFIRPLETREARADEVAHFLDRRGVRGADLLFHYYLLAVEFT